MKIEIVDNKRFSQILVDEEVFKEIHRKLYKNYLRKILRAFTKEDLNNLCLEADLKIARWLVYKWLALRGFMKSELQVKLKRYKIDPRAIDQLLEECEKKGYIDDLKEGKLFIERQKRRGLGPQMIALKLGQKAPELKEMVRLAVTDEEQAGEIQKWIEKKTRLADFSDIKVKERLYRFLRGKGFDDHLVRSSLFKK